MWLSSLNIFEENQIYEEKKEKHLTQIIRGHGCITKVRISKNNQ